MMANSTARPGELICGINVTPLVDVVLVLLIILMVTAKYAESQVVPLELPRAKSGEAGPDSPLAISVDAAGALFLDGRMISKEDLRARARALPEPARRAVIAADGSASHRAVVGVLDLLRGEGVTRFAINVAPEDLER
jgi:biopolymer transport protein ExbD